MPPREMASPHFARAELACRHCGAMEFTPRAIQRLEDVRVEFDAPMRISSGYRCPYHNAAVSATGRNGPHTITGGDNITVDVLVSGSEAYRLLAIFMRHSWSGLGFQQKGPHDNRFIHADRLWSAKGRPRPTIWGY